MIDLMWSKQAITQRSQRGFDCALDDGLKYCVQHGLSFLVNIVEPCDQQVNRWLRNFRPYTTLFTDGFDFRRHVTLGCKSPEPVSFATEATLGMLSQPPECFLIVPTTGVFPGKVFSTKCTEEEFVIGQVLR